ncbi:hypothetical protein VMCG_00679 [Cytospora schulzeri]|uniref:Uncharacterized protein n=1 Tax=Cytospora schulzeri TaxID=448051 RepID=A0A423X962_9PEZI|nr:hypothetical protein VMCG_00679 [Valsa malicola]
MFACRQAIGRCLSRSASGRSVRARLSNLGQLQGFHSQTRRPLPFANREASSLLPKSHRHSSTIQPAEVNVKQDLEKSGHSEQPFIIYRTTYADNEAWARFKEAVDKHWSEHVARCEEFGLPESLEWMFVEDQGALDGASREQLRARFNAWVPEAVKIEDMSVVPVLEVYRLPYFQHFFSQYRYFVQVDEEALRELVDTDWKDYMLFGHVKFVDPWWKPEPEDGIGEYEPVDGYTGEDVGWFKIAPDLLFTADFWERISDESWYIHYQRPPEMLYC